MGRGKKASVVVAGAALAALTASLLPSSAGAVVARATGDVQQTPNANNSAARGKSGSNLTVDPNNPNRVVELHQDLVTEQCEYNLSTDGGTTWTGGGKLTGPAGYPTGNPVGPCDVTGHGASNIGQRSLEFGSGSNVYAVWTSTKSLGAVGFSVLLSKSTDGGATFPSAVEIPGMIGAAAPGNDFSHPELVVDRRSATTDRIFVSSKEGRSGKALVTRSDDAGATWNTPVEASLVSPLANPAPVWDSSGLNVTTAGNAFIRTSELTSPVLGPVPAGPTSGYRMVGADGAVYTFGNAGNFGSLAGQALAKPIVGSATTPSGNGYWLVASDGGIFAFGDAGFFGSTGNLTLAKPIVGMAATPSGQGYWLVASDGGIFAFGDAGFYGSTGNLTLAKPIVGMAPTPSGKGYWLVASDGGIFAFGDAGFYGSTGNLTLAKPIVGINVSPTGKGYNLVASDGGVFSFGDAGFFGSTGGSNLGSPVVSISPSNKIGGIRPLYLGWNAPKNSGACPPNCEQLGENSTDGYIVVAKSLDSGQTWTRSRAINVEGFVSPSGSLFGGSNFPRLATGPGGEVYLTFNQGPGVFGSNNCGTGPFPVPAAGAAGTLTCPSYGTSGFKQADHFMNWDMDPWFMRSTNGGTTWSAPRQLNEPKKPGLAAAELTQTRHPEIIVAPNGRISIAWEDRRHWFLGTSDRKNAVISNTSADPSPSALANYACVHSHSNCPEARLGDTYLAQSTDNGVTFGLNKRVNDRSHNNDVGYDYRFSAYWDYGPAVAALGNDKLLVSDMDSRLGNPNNDSLDNFFRKVDLVAPDAIPSTSITTGSAPSFSVALSQRTMPGGGEAVHGNGFTNRPWTRPVIVNEADMPSALAGGVLARANLGPVLASPQAGLPANVKNEVDRLDPIGAYVIGDATKLGPQVDADLIAAGVPAAQIVHISGATPAEIAANIAITLDRRRAVDKTTTPPLPAFDAVIIANPNSASAASASALAANRRLPILYTDQNSVPAATLNAITALGVTQKIIVGSTGVISNQILNASARALTDVATTSGSSTITSATGAFTEADIGRGFSGANVPAGTTIIGVTSPTTATLSAPATATAGPGPANAGGSCVPVAPATTCPNPTYTVAARTSGLSSSGVTRLSGADQFGTSNAVVTESLNRGLPRNIVYVADGAEPMHAALLGWSVARMGGLLTLAPGGSATTAEANLAGAPFNLRPYIDRIITSDLTGTAVVGNDAPNATP